MRTRTISAAACCFAMLSAQAAAQDQAGAGRRIDVQLMAVPTAYHVFMSGRHDEKIVEVRTKGCRTELKTSGGLVDSIDWTRSNAAPDHGAFAQVVGTRNAAGTLADFTAYIPGQSTTEQAMGERYKNEFNALYSDMTSLSKSCVGKQ